MDREEILEKVKNFITDTLDIKIDQLVEEYKLNEELGLDSLDRVVFFMDLEKEFNIAIPEEEEEDIVTIKELIDYLVTKL